MSRKLKSFQDCFSDFLRDRVFDGSCVLVMNDPEYQKHNEKVLELFDQLTEVLGEEHSHLLMRLEEQINTCESISLEYAYKQGFRDGIQLNRELDAIASERGVANERSLTC
jgi:hypothetical protein